MTRRSQSIAGFTMLEVIVVVAIMVIVAGVAVPSSARLVTRTKTKATTTEMTAIGDALLDYVEENGSWPAALSVLTTAGYLGGGFSPAEALTDSWGMAYEYTSSRETSTLRSLGPDRRRNRKDLVLTVDARARMREVTRDEMETIHVALRSYEIARGRGDVPALPAAWAGPGGALEGLVAAGYLPDDPRFETDAWGDEYVFAGSPSDAVTSAGVGP